MTVISNDTATMAIAALMATAFITTMPEEPPGSLREFPRWLYKWTHDGLKLFINMRHPSPPEKK